MTKNNDIIYIEIPTVCPVCGGTTQIIGENDSEVLICTNLACAGKKLGQFVHFCSKKAMNIDGLSEATLETLLSHGYIHDFRSIYHLSDYYNELVNLDGFGSKSVKKLLQSIENSRNVDLAHFICALSIPQIGSTASKTLADFCGTWSEFAGKLMDGYDFTALPDFGETTNKAIYNWSTFNLMKFGALAQEMHFTQEEKRVVAENPFMNKVICVTGKLEHFNRDSINAKIESLGAKVASGVTVKTDILITNTPDSGSSKNQKAQQFGTKIITEEQFLKMIGE